jgi:CheY-like chemotaxis protein
VRADPSQVEQVILNLAINARDAMPAGGHLSLRTRPVTVDASFIEQHPQFAPGDYVVLEVADTGTGMTAEVQAHLFEPFFTTKDPGKGTGLGLATAYGIVTQNGGHILVQSQLGDGSVFRVYLPRSAGDLANVAAAVPALMPHGTERLLLVEDERSVREVAERTLRALGYVVTTAGDGLEALAALEAAHGNFALVLTDVRMPRCTGIELAERLHGPWPHLKVVFMSGHSEALLAQGAMRTGIVVLPKPFTASELAVCVRAALDTKPA